MRLKKPLAWTAAGAAAFLLLVIALLWLGARTSAARRAASEYLSALTGLPVTVGSLAIGLLPTPSMELGGLAMAQPPGFDSESLLELGSAHMAVPWSVVFGGEPVLRSVSISGATVRAAIAVDGADNWSALIARLSALGGGEASGWFIGRFDVERSALEFRDAVTGSQWRLTAITAGAQSIAPASDFPVELRLGGVHGANTFHFALTGHASLDPDASHYAGRDLTLRGWVGGEPLPLAGIELAGSTAVASFDGKTGVATIRGGTMTFAGIRSAFRLDASDGDGEASLNFALRTEPFSPRAAASAFGRPLPTTNDPQAFHTLQLAIGGRMQAGRLRLDPVEGRLDDTGFAGHALPQLRQFRLHADRIDMDRYLAPERTEPKAVSDPEATLEAALAELGKLDIDAEIRIDEVRVAGARLRDALLKFERNDAAPP